MRKLKIENLNYAYISDSHLSVTLFTDGGRVVDAKVSVLLFRGFEYILLGKSVFDVPFLASRVCGLCFSTHQLAAARAVESAYGMEVPTIANLMRNLMLASVFIASHIFHFYARTLPDYLNIAKVLEYRGNDPELLGLKARIKNLIESGDSSPFAPESKADELTVAHADEVIDLLHHYLQAFKIKSLAKAMGAVFGGREPHYQTIVVGGVTLKPRLEQVIRFKSYLDEVADFVKKVYVPDVLALALGLWLESGQRGDGCFYNNFISIEDFFDSDRKTPTFKSGLVVKSKTESLTESILKRIEEDLSYSFLRDDLKGFDAQKKDAYTFCAAPRFDGLPFETGPLSRMLVLNEENLSKVVHEYGLKPGTVLRHLSRAFEALLLVKKMYEWLEEVLEASHSTEGKVVSRKKAKGLVRGVGIVEAPGGLTIHDMAAKDGIVKEYRIISGPTWNASPHDAKNQPGPLEAALKDIPYSRTEGKLLVKRVLNSFELCPRCASH